MSKKTAERHRLMKARDKAKLAIIDLLVKIDEPQNEREALALAEDWSKLALSDLIEAQDYNVYHVDEPPAELVRKVSLALAYLRRAEANAAKEAVS